MKDCFFIVGSPRSGTTLLQRMLDGHAEIAVTPETHFGARYFKRRSRFDRGSDASAQAEARYAFLDHYCASKDFAALRIDEASFRIAAAAQPGEPWWPLQVAMTAFGQRHGKQHVGEKTPSHALYVESLAAAFPTARFLMLWRDPRAMAASLTKVSWSQRNSVEAAAIWRRYSKAMRRARARLPGRCLELRYENLVAEPERALSEICSFLNVSYDAGMLDYPTRPLPARTADTRLTALPPQTGRIGAWRNSMPAEEVSRVEVVCGREMRRLGYAPEAPRVSRWAAEARIGPAMRWKRFAKRVKNRTVLRSEHDGRG